MLILSIINLIIWFILGVFILSKKEIGKLDFGLVWILLITNLMVVCLDNAVK